MSLKCRLCKRVTPKKESTGTFISYYRWTDKEGHLRKDTHGELKVCVHCIGEVLLK